MPSVNVFDWERIKSDFVEGVARDGGAWYPNLRELAELHDINYSRLRYKAGEERWYDERQAYLNYVELQRREARAHQLAEQGIAFDDDALQAARKGLQAVLRRLDEAEETGDLAAAEAANLARAAASWQVIGRKALGDVDGLRLEVSGVAGSPIEIDIEAEMKKDDPERLADFIEAMDRSGLLQHLAPRAELEEGVIEVDGEPADTRPNPEDVSDGAQRVN